MARRCPTCAAKARSLTRRILPPTPHAHNTHVTCSHKTHGHWSPQAVEVYEAFRELHDQVAMAEGGSQLSGIASSGIGGLDGLHSGGASGLGLQREMWDALSCASSEMEPGGGRDRSWTGGGNSPSLAMLLPVRRDGVKIVELTGDVEGRDCIVVVRPPV